MGIFTGPAEHNDSPPVVQLTAADDDDAYDDTSNTSIQADHPVDILLPAHENVPTSMSAPAEEGHDPQSIRKEAQQQNPGNVDKSENDEGLLQAMAPRMPTEAEPATIIGVDTAWDVEEDAAHRMLLQAVADLQAENASLTKALSVQSQELQSLR